MIAKLCIKNITGWDRRGGRGGRRSLQKGAFPLGQIKMRIKNCEIRWHGLPIIHPRLWWYISLKFDRKAPKGLLTKKMGRIAVGQCFPGESCASCQAAEHTLIPGNGGYTAASLPSRPGKLSPRLNFPFSAAEAAANPHPHGAYPLLAFFSLWGLPSFP